MASSRGTGWCGGAIILALPPVTIRGQRKLDFQLQLLQFMLLPLISPSFIGRRIYLIRKQKVMLDSDLAELYGVETFNLNKAVKRNSDRFPDDFMFQLSQEETEALRFQIGISKVAGHGGRRYLPYAFTEQGVAMLSSVLHSKRAVQVNITIMRAFVQLREMLATHKDLAKN